MFRFLRRWLSKRSSAGVTLPFNRPQAAFEYCCRFMDCSLREGVTLPAIVLDATEEFGFRVPVGISSTGTQQVALKIPADDGGFLVMAEALSEDGPTLYPGMLVAWSPFKYVPEVGEGLAARGGDKRSGWAGMVLASLQSVWKDGYWLVEQRFAAPRRK